MAQISYRANLSAKSFPFTSIWQGRTIIVNGPDQTFNRTLSSNADVDRDVGFPQIYYGHNILPTQEGFNSVGYESKVTICYVLGLVQGISDPPYSPAGTNFNVYHVLPLVSTAVGAEVSIYTYNYVAGGPGTLNSYYLNNLNEWIQLSSSGVPLEKYYSMALTLNNISYIHERLTPINRLLQWTGVGFTLLAYPTALNNTTTEGMLAANGYAIAYTASAVAWSFNIADFTPSLVTGAGGASVQDVKGEIKYCTPTSFGFMIYATLNVVAAIYTGNSRYPYKFQEVRGSGGFVSKELIASDANSDYQIAWTTAGLQNLTSSLATSFLPALVDYIKSNLYEDFDVPTLTFSELVQTLPFNKKLTMIGNRYLILSYGPNSVSELMKYAIVYDIALGRYGKLKRDHIEVFDWNAVASTVPSPENTGIAMMNASGYINVIRPYFDVNNTIDACILLGKYQYSRSRRLTLDKLWLENVSPGNNLGVYDLTTNDGKTFQAPVAGYLLAEESAGRNKSYLFTAEGINHSILLTGNFNLDSFVLDFHLSGKQ